MTIFDRFLVSINCMTYNHSAYITDAMDGFAMQQTNFPFVSVIVDDASTDGEQKMIKTYIEEHFDHSEKTGYRDWETEDAYWIFARHKGNENCHFVAIILKKNLFKEPEKKEAVIKEWTNTKYIAVCEGDDYWIDPLKLQRQVNFLEEHEDYSLSSENGVIEFFSTQTTALFNEEETRDVSFEDLLIKRRFPTASVVYRKSCINGFEKLIPPKFDTLMWAYLAKQGRVHYNSVVSSVYRRGAGITSADSIRWAYIVRDFNISINKNFNSSKAIMAIRYEDVYENLINGIIDAKRQNRFSDVIKLSYYGFQIHPKRMIKWLIKKVFGK
jgi:glycosyltransferase involved in cell wall biosynthesis